MTENWTSEEWNSVIKLGPWSHKKLVEINFISGTYITLPHSGINVIGNPLPKLHYTFVWKVLGKQATEALFLHIAKAS
jgi:hypothetical protein